MADIAKVLIVMGLVLAAFGATLWVLSGVPFVGRLPGDISIQRGNITFYFPLATCIVISIIASLIFALLRR